MARPKTARPAYRYHISGQAIVTFNGRDFYLGEFNSPQSNARYLELLSIYQASGLRMPDDVPTHQQDTPITVGQLIGEWKEHVSGRSDLVRYKPLLDIFELEYTTVPVAEFGPRKLKEVRDTLLSDGNQSRKWINEQIRAACRIFKHGVSVELIEFDVYNKLTTLEPLKRGHTTAREQEPRQPVPLADIAATVAELTPVLAAMVRIQLATGMRSGELCRIRPCDIDQSGPEWIYRQSDHKTSHHGVKKAVPIVGYARQILTDYMNRHPESYCFSPTESDEWHRSMRRNKRITPLKYEKREFAYDQKKNRFYNSNSYRQSIQRAAKRAGVTKWTPAQIRHTTATEIRAAIGLEAASALLGHTTIGMTEHYARESEARAITGAQVATNIARQSLSSRPSVT
ncbi:site-specific tyrosine recombinase XerC [Stieleria maiorica]|uniref:Site-specific tyrosine recombinase XerC n=1 Tax=Stieleria maiorica TaxID=2795974 RepID=A0A5B9M973_9BACT|nr:tyrosine-type recombinase/integrase [Stieleria maiorica]QEF97732.1 site-specific tyrosine recombinase XerC [Stieleria maiorica]